jgi:glycosyltransferase involved in cell wall biosynthesis
MRGDIFYDLTEFVERPMRTGIQRVCYEVLRHWKFSPRLVPGFIDANTSKVFVLPEDFPDYLRGWFEDSSSGRTTKVQDVWQGLRRRSKPLFGRFSRKRSHLEKFFQEFSSILNPELFFDEKRLEFYSRLAAHAPERVHWIVYDALPWLRPEFFTAGAPGITANYLRVLRKFPNLHFISQESKKDFCQRIFKTDKASYDVCPLGADGLGVAAASSPNSKRFTYVSTIEPRKNHVMLFRAFEEIWRETPEVELTLVGTPVNVTEEITAGVERMARYGSRFSWRCDLDSSEVGAIIRSSRATIYASDAEGFGLPALESLALGVPVIAWTHLPSLSTIPDAGQVRLEEMSIGQVTSAVRRMLVDEFAEQKYAEISRLVLPTWKGLAKLLHGRIVGSLQTTVPNDREGRLNLQVEAGQELA